MTKKKKFYNTDTSSPLASPGVTVVTASASSFRQRPLSDVVAGLSDARWSLGGVAGFKNIFLDPLMASSAGLGTLLVGVCTATMLELDRMVPEALLASALLARSDNEDSSESIFTLKAGNTKRGKYHRTIDLLFDWFGISCMTTDDFLFLFAKQTNPNQSNRRSTVQ